MMFFNTIKKETENLITLTNDTEKIIMSLFLILTGSFYLWLFIIKAPFFNNLSIDLHNLFNMTIAGAIFLSLPILFLLQGFHDLIIKSKAKIDFNLQKIILERKSIIKNLNSVKEINICNLNKFEIVEVDEPESVYSWYIDFVTNTGKLNFTLYSNKSELKKLSNKLNKLINP